MATPGRSQGLPIHPKVQQAKETLSQAEADFKAGRIEEALLKCRKALDLNPQAADAYFLVGMIQDRKGAHEEAQG